MGNDQALVDNRIMAESDPLALVKAKQACSDKSNEFRPGLDQGLPHIGGDSEYTKCMLQQANAKKGSVMFEQICSAIPGARSDLGGGNCSVSHY